MATPADLGHHTLTVVPLPEGIRIEDDVEIPLRDGVRLHANVYRPAHDRPCPVIVALTPYGKDHFPGDFPVDLDTFAERGLSIGHLRLSERASFESPDPASFVPHDYALVVVDVRGFHRSGGRPGLFSPQDARDASDVIDWAAGQHWSTGKVALAGTSYLAIIQWYVAARRPAGLAAIIPWDGMTDPYADSMIHGGIPETRFSRAFFPMMLAGAARLSPTMNRITGLASDVLPQAAQFVVPAARVDRITVPALVGVAWADHGLHTRGCLAGYVGLRGPKWLFAHGGKAWETYYGAESVAAQLAFLDHVLKGVDNGLDREPHVRLEVLRTRTEREVRREREWPLARTAYTPLYLDSGTGTMSEERPAAHAFRSYAARGGQAVFDHRFEADTELTGYMAAKLWVQTRGAPDADLFVRVDKLDAEGNVVPFEDRAGYESGPITRGWLRLSWRGNDPKRSAEGRPVVRRLPWPPRFVTPRDVVPANVEILASATAFRAGEGLRLTVAGHDICASPEIGHDLTINLGQHRIHSGGTYDSHLLVPVIPPA